MEASEKIDTGLPTARAPRLAEKLRADTLATVALAAFAVAAPWSIAAAQISVGLATLALLLLVVERRRRARASTEAREARDPDAHEGFPAGGRPALLLPWTLRLVLLFLAVQALSIVASVDPARALRAFRGSWTYLFPFLFWFWMRSDPTRSRLTARCLVGSAALAGLYAVIQAVTGTSPLDGEILEDHGGTFMATGTLGHHLTFAGVMLPIFFIALGHASELRRRGRWTAAAWCGVALIGAGVLFSFARSAWIALAAGLLVFALHHGRRALALSAAALLAVVAAVYALLPAIRERVAAIDVARGPRFNLWESAWNIGVAHPWLGGGLGSWKELFPLHQAPGTYISIAHPHNDVLNVLVECGFTGAFVWILIWVAFFVELRPRRPLTAGVQAAVAALLVSGVFQCLITDEEVAQTWMLVVALGLAWRGAAQVESAPAVAIASGKARR